MASGEALSRPERLSGGVIFLAALMWLLVGFAVVDVGAEAIVRASGYIIPVVLFAFALTLALALP
jgi:hypothetical protein